MTHRLSSATQRRAMPYPAGLRCCCVLCCIHSLLYMPVSFDVSYHVPILLQQRQVCIHYFFLNDNTKNAPPTQISPQLYVAQQRRAVRCRSLPCLALRWVLFRAALCFLPSIQRYQVYYVKYQVQVCTCCVLVFLLSSVYCPLSVPMPPSPPANYTRTADQNVTPSTSTQHSAQHRAYISSSAKAALGIISSLVAPSHAPLLSTPLYMF